MHLIHLDKKFISFMTENPLEETGFYGRIYPIEELRIAAAEKYSERPLLKQDNVKIISAFIGFNILVTTVTSTDPTYKPYACKVGYIAFPLIAFFIAFVTFLSFFLYTKSWQFFKNFGYPDVWEQCIDKKTSFLPRLAVLICFLLLFGTFAEELLFDLETILTLINPEIDSVYLSLYFLGYVNAAVLFIVAICHSDYADFGITAVIANLCLLFYAGTEIYIFIASSNTSDDYIIKFSRDINDYKDAIGDFIQCYFMNPLLNYLLGRLETPTRNQAVSLSLGVTFVTFLFNTGMGIIPYLTEKPQDGSYLTVTSFVFSPWFRICLSITAYIQVVMCASIYLFLVAKETLDIFLPNGSESTIATVAASLTFSFIIPLYNVLPEMVLVVIDYVNQVCFFILAFLLPPLFYILKSRFTNKFLVSASIFLLATGIAIQIVLLI
jgi:hypothetical protein